MRNLVEGKDYEVRRSFSKNHVELLCVRRKEFGDYATVKHDQITGEMTGWEYYKTPEEADESHRKRTKNWSTILW